MATAFDPKCLGDLDQSQTVQGLRDRLVCSHCGHPCLAHGYGTGQSFVDGSRIGLGECADCDCREFAHEEIPSLSVVGTDTD